jgi:hypothetical protein
MVIKEVRVGDVRYKPQARLTPKGIDYVRGRVSKGTFFKKDPV